MPASPVQAQGEISQGKARDFRSICPPHLRPLGPGGFRASGLVAPSPTSRSPLMRFVFLGPELCLRSQFIEISERLHRLGTIVQSPGDRGCGTQNINHDSCIRTVCGTDRVGNMRGRMEIGNLHGHTHRQRASQYRDHPC